MIDKNYCMSSYMAFRYIENENKDFFEGLHLDLNRVRTGESKYLIRELMAKKYPEITVPDKIPMPRPVDFYFKNWGGPTRPEFKKDLNMAEFTGNQKWQMFGKIFEFI